MTIGFWYDHSIDLVRRGNERPMVVLISVALIIALQRFMDMEESYDQNERTQIEDIIEMVRNTSLMTRICLFRLFISLIIMIKFPNRVSQNTEKERTLDQ